jgi:hypothetical protein
VEQEESKKNYEIKRKEKLKLKGKIYPKGGQK